MSVRSRVSRVQCDQACMWSSGWWAQHFSLSH